MQEILDFNDAELWTMRSALEERYGKAVELQLVESEIRMHPADRSLTKCPALFWSERDANFVVVKVEESAYRSQFYCCGYQQYGTGIGRFDNVGDCVITLLPVQTDHERKQAETKESTKK